MLISLGLDSAWKPLAGPVRDWPIAYCDPTTVDPENDLLAVDNVFKGYVLELYQLQHTAKQRWYFVPDQTASEVVIFNGYDSRRGQGMAVPHCAFSLDGLSSGPSRESIEVRAFVVL